MDHPTPPSGASQPARPDTARALVAAGRELFAARGFDGASVRAITRAAGANLGAVTYHFGSKRELYAVVLQEGLSPLADQVEAAAAGPGTPLDRIVLIVKAYFEHFRKNPELPRLMLQEISAGRRPPDVVIELIRRVARTIASLYQEGAADGSLREGDPFLTAASVVAQPLYLTLVGPLFLEVTGWDLREPDTHEQVVAHTTSFIRAGLESPREEADS